jgi:hypothetical protein
VTFLLSRIEHAARAFFCGGDLDRRVTRSVVEHETFDGEFPDGPYIPGFDYTPAPGVMQDMGANCAAAAEMFPQHTKTSVARPPGVAETPGRVSSPLGVAGHQTPVPAGSQHGLPPRGGERFPRPAPSPGHSDFRAGYFAAVALVQARADADAGLAAAVTPDHPVDPQVLLDSADTLRDLAKYMRHIAPK